MKGSRKFPSQTAGLRYFALLLIEQISTVRSAALIKDAFRDQLAYHKTDRRNADENDDFLREMYNIVVPMFSFFAEAANREGIMYSLPRFAEGNRPIWGQCSWHGSSTPGRFVRIRFGKDGSCVMFYDTGYRTGDGEMVPKGACTFLGLPEDGDEDLSHMGRNEFYEFARS